MKKIFNLLLILNVVIFSGCDDYLDVKPVGLVVPRNIEHYKLLLFGGRFSVTLTSNDNDLNLSADDFEPFRIGDTEDPTNVNLQLFTWATNLYSDDNGQRSWNLPYSNIYTFNTVINEVDDASPAVSFTEADKAVIKAQAKAQRAFEYWMLVNSFAKAYNQSSATNDSGVPLVTTSDVSAVTPQRATVQEVYDFIINDLKEAVDDLPETASNPVLASKGAAYAMLSRVYLFMGNYSEGMTYADLALQENNFIADYTTGISEFEQQHYMRKLTGVGLGYRSGTIHPELYSSFDPTDARVNEFIVVFPFLPGPVIRSIFDQQISIWPMVQEMYLVKAECNARLSNTADAITDLNALRVKRIPAYVDLTSGDFDNDAELLSFVLEERRRELFRISIRWFDLKRLNLDAATSKTIAHSLEGNDFILAPNANNYVWPIPQQVIGFNPNMEQNPRD